jgi:hypothetical protein
MYQEEGVVPEAGAVPGVGTVPGAGTMPLSRLISLRSGHHDRAPEEHTHAVSGGGA